ncbi:MAG TPA: PilT/PilU family type 4a pilus ATPase [Verrucomicrobiae bacterium]|jgi:twitching motility protein PilT|nr:PilT/PilU family type 4a pilus ATPase [Verrucomicrobiae bacterium]
MERIPTDNSLGKILGWCANQRATDIHAQAGRRIAFRVDGKLYRIPPETIHPLDNDALLQVLEESFSEAAFERIEKQRETDLHFICGQVRYRANFSKQQGTQSFSLRVVPQRVLKLDDLQLPSTVLGLIKDPRGLVLVTGASGQGKSTTACALLQQLNETTPLRIVTIEDPIEYLFEENQCQFEQREVGVDTESFAAGIRNAMRQDPEVIFIGEIRDRESIHAAMQAAEMGFLVLTTLHADSAAQAIDRVREFYPVTEQPNAVALLSRTLSATVSQRLVPSTFDCQIPCVEVMKRTLEIQDAIFRNDRRQLNGYIESSLNDGMHSFDQYLQQLYQGGRVTMQVAKHYAVNRSSVERESRGLVSTSPVVVSLQAA